MRLTAPSLSCDLCSVKSNPGSRLRSIAAFTLVELLVVIGIIALLISILLPSLNSARQAALNLKCLSNLRVLGQAMALYLNDNRQTFPQPDKNGAITVNGKARAATGDMVDLVQTNCLWFNALDLYLNRSMPADYATATTRNYTLIKQDPIWPTFNEVIDSSNSYGSRTYKMNDYLGGSYKVGTTTFVRWTKTSKTKESTRVPVFFDAVSQDCCTLLPVISSDTFAPAFSGTEGYVGLRHNRKKSANVVCMDGHAESLTQPIYAYKSSSGKSIFNTWYYEYLNTGGTTATTAAQALAGTKQDSNQSLVWNVWHNG